MEVLVRCRNVSQRIRYDASPAVMDANVRRTRLTGTSCRAGVVVFSVGPG